MVLPVAIGGVRYGMELFAAGSLAIAAGAAAILINGV
jgi:hypothetical protein